MRLFLSSLAICAAFLCADAWTMAGETLEFDVVDSALFPGTQRRVQVYVPKQYTTESEAWLYVGLDGNLFNAVATIDSLICENQLPQMIGVFVEPGRVVDRHSNVLRYNRSYEFDSCSPLLAEFVETEVFPRVEKLTTADGRAIRLTRNPDRRIVAGASSSGIAAFTMAWERPDLFRRVYSACGTFVAMRGGNSYNSLIRKTEPKPIRVFLQDGEKDAWNPLFGDWYEENLAVESALRFAGYAVDHEWGDGGHSIAHGTRIFDRVIRWLCQGDSVPIGKSQNDMLEQILLDGSGWTKTDSVVDTATPLPYDSICAMMPNCRHVAVASPTHPVVYDHLLAPDGSLYAAEPFYRLDGDSPAYNLIYDNRGNLYCSTRIGIQVCDHNGRVRAILPVPVRCRYRIGWGGDDFTTLYVISDDGNFCRQMKCRGWLPWQPVVDIVSQGQG